MNVTDRSIERSVSVLLMAGVIVSGAVVLAGGILFLIRHGGEPADYRVFHKAPSADRIIPEIVAGVLRLRARSVIQFGLLLLIATPVMRVAISLIGFALERDRTFVIITAIVFLILLYSLIHGAVTV